MPSQSARENTGEGPGAPASKILSALACCRLRNRWSEEQIQSRDASFIKIPLEVDERLTSGRPDALSFMARNQDRGTCSLPARRSFSASFARSSGYVVVTTRSGARLVP
jgi:hypothetical protein